MKKLGILLLLISLIGAKNVFAETPVGHSRKALTHSAQSVQNSAQALGHSVVGAAKLTGAVIAVPFKVVGAGSNAIGTVSNRIGDDLWNSAAGRPLEVTDRNFIKAGPSPHDAIQE